MNVVLQLWQITAMLCRCYECGLEAVAIKCYVVNSLGHIATVSEEILLTIHVHKGTL